MTLKRCVCGHIKTSHAEIGKRDEGGKVIYVDGAPRNEMAGKCKFPNCKCEGYK